MKNTNQMIGCCGLDCEKCDARIATITNNNTLREKNCRPVDNAQRGDEHAGNDQLHRLPPSRWPCVSLPRLSRCAPFPK